jgi:hypothetical protein
VPAAASVCLRKASGSDSKPTTSHRSCASSGSYNSTPPLRDGPPTWTTRTHAAADRSEASGKSAVHPELDGGGCCIDLTTGRTEISPRSGSGSGSGPGPGPGPGPGGPGPSSGSGSSSSGSSASAATSSGAAGLPQGRLSESQRTGSSGLVATCTGRLD